MTWKWPKIRMAVLGQNTASGDFDWKDACIDAGITSGLTFFTTLGGATLLGASGRATILTAAVSAAAQFFLFLTLKRGLTTSGQTTPTQ